MRRNAETPSIGIAAAETSMGDLYEYRITPSFIAFRKNHFCAIAAFLRFQKTPHPALDADST